MIELKQKIALFIDADNASANKFGNVLSEVAIWCCNNKKSVWELEKSLFKVRGRASTRICGSAGTTILGELKT